MQTLISNKLIFPQFPSNYFFTRTRYNHNNPTFLKFYHQIQRHCTQKARTLCTATSSDSLSYGGWEDYHLGGDSVQSGESAQLHNFLNSLGLDDKRYIFVYLFGFVCALAVSRVKVSSIVVVPACAVVFAVGFSIGLVNGGRMSELRLNGNKKKVKDEIFRGSIDKLRSLVDLFNGFDAEIIKVKNDILKGIECNRVSVNDLEGYFNAVEMISSCYLDAKNVVEGCIGDMLGDDQEKEGVSNPKTSRKKKESGENRFNIGQYFTGLFGKNLQGSKPSRSKDSDKNEIVDSGLKEENILAANVREQNSDYSSNGNLKDHFSSKPFDNPSMSQDGAERIRMESRNEKMNFTGIEETVFDHGEYGYLNKRSRYLSEERVFWKMDHTDETESRDFRVSMNRRKTTSSFEHEQEFRSMEENYLHLESTGEDVKESQGSFLREPSFTDRELTSENSDGSYPSSILANDSEFNRYIHESNILLKEAKECLRQQDDETYAENALYKSAKLLSKAMEMRPMSLLAVGQLGNTYLLHGELKLRISRELRSILSRNDRSSWDDLEKVLNRFDADKDRIASKLVDVCEECEELLVKAGRKYRLALSIDGNDMRAMYNWGLALSFRAQLLADIGPDAARDADKVFMAAIDKFDAMMSKSNLYAPDALYRWGAALQQRSRLRPRNSREKVKLLQQAKRLYQDALNMDSRNPQLKRALSSCISELDGFYS